MTTIKAMRLASVVTAINVLVAGGFSIVGIIHPQYLVPAESVRTQASLILAMYAAARTIPLALFALWASSSDFSHDTGRRRNDRRASRSCCQARS